MTKKVILTGLRANNDLHLGNYLGALLPIVEMANTKSDEFDINLFIPDLHSFTTPIDHTKLRAQIFGNLRVFVAAGLNLDSNSINIYRQSYIPAHSELTWILDCFTGMGEMGRMIQFKDKSQSMSEDRISVGLFNYPVLMAADILLYDAVFVPVGDDQSQHLEFTRDIAERFNTKFGEVFTVPNSVEQQHKFFGKDQGLRIKDLADPSKKMSKSSDSSKGVVFLSDSPETATEKIMSATTDSVGIINYNSEKQPGISNLLDIYHFMGGGKDDFLGSKSYGELKKSVAEKVANFLTNFQSKIETIDPDNIHKKLINSEAKMNEVANTKLNKVQKAVGLR